MLTALTRSVSPSIDSCALSFMEREPIQVALAQRQHLAYEKALQSLGVHVSTLPVEPHMPDAVFVEDTAVVVNEVAVITYPALSSRQCERHTVAEALAPYRRLAWITGDARLEGGDVLRMGRTLYVGHSGRTNAEGIAQLREILAPYEYEVLRVPVPGCLHLKTGVTAIGPQSLLTNTAWVDTDFFSGCDILPVPPGEEFAANVLMIGQTVLMPAAFPRTASLLEEFGLGICPVDISELQKAEAGVTCCSILF